MYSFFSLYFFVLFYFALNGQGIDTSDGGWSRRFFFPLASIYFCLDFVCPSHQVKYSSAQQTSPLHLPVAVISKFDTLSSASKHIRETCRAAPAHTL